MNLTDKITGSTYFTWKEALYLPQWDCCHTPSKDEQANIIKLAKIMDQIRKYVNHPINVHVWIRPILNNPSSPHHGQDYNKLIGGAVNSAHKIGSAVDWDCGEDCDATRAKLLSQLAILGIRMEDKPNSSWVHTDDMAPHPHRFFIP